MLCLTSDSESVQSRELCSACRVWWYFLGGVTVCFVCSAIFVDGLDTFQTCEPPNRNVTRSTNVGTYVSSTFNPNSCTYFEYDVIFDVAPRKHEWVLDKTAQFGKPINHRDLTTRIPIHTQHSAMTQETRSSAWTAALQCWTSILFSLDSGQFGVFLCDCQLL